MKKKQANKNFSVFTGVRALTLAAMLTAMSVVIGIFCKNFMNFGGGLFRITFENLPIILSGIIFGPVVGGVVGVATDLISYLLSNQIYPPNLVVTVGAAVIGLVSGLVSKYVVRKNGYTRIILSTLLAHVLGSMIIKTAGLFVFYSWMVLWRIPVYLAISAIETTVLCLMYKNSNFKKVLGWN